MTASGPGHCWGEGDGGQLGNGDSANVSTPAAAAAPSGGSTLSFSRLYASGADGGITYVLMQ